MVYFEIRVPVLLILVITLSISKAAIQNHVELFH